MLTAFIRTRANRTRTASKVAAEPQWMLISVLMIIILSLSTPISAEPNTIVGRASVIDGDTIKIHGQRIRLFGIDAPESRQTCSGGNGKAWRCGQASTLALSDAIGTATISCRPNGKGRHRRVLAACFKGSDDLNGWMVRNGWAVAYRRYSSAYINEETAAMNAGLNMWAGKFAMPWDWRTSH